MITWSVLTIDRLSVILESRIFVRYREYTYYKYAKQQAVVFVFVDPGLSNSFILGSCLGFFYVLYLYWDMVEVFFCRRVAGKPLVSVVIIVLIVYLLPANNTILAVLLMLMLILVVLIVLIKCC